MQIDSLKSLQIGSRKPTEQEIAQLQKLEDELKTATEKLIAFFKNAEIISRFAGCNRRVAICFP